MAEEQKSARRPGQAAVFKGSCACGRVAFECAQVPSNVTACHCVTCRKLSGGAYQAFADVQDDAVVWLDTVTQLRHHGLPADGGGGGIVYQRYSAVSERAFCAACHAPLAMRYGDEPAEIGLNLGLVDEDSLDHGEVRAKQALQLQQHIFVSQKACWVDIAGDRIPAFERFPPVYEKVVGELQRQKERQQ